MRRKYPSWSPEEDEVLLRTHSSQNAHEILRDRRTLAAVVQRRHVLRHPPEKATAVRAPGRRLWTAKEETILKRKWPLAHDTAEIRACLPRFTPEQIRSKAHVLRLKRWFSGADIALDGHKELIDQIRIRAKQDGIPLLKLDKIVGASRYFGHANWKTNKKINFAYVARAIEFFGGTLAIDWRDR